MKKLIIIGGGFAGMNLARKIDHSIWEVTIVDRHNYNSFPPLFYQVASSGLEPSNISFPFRRELKSRRYHSCTFIMSRVKSVDTARREVHTDFGPLPYDALVLAVGTTNNFFGMDSLRKSVLTLKSTPQAIRLRNEILDRLERAAVCTDESLRRRLLTFVVVGGGPAGVEVAGALGELKRYVLRREYPSINADEMRVILVEGSDALLRTMSSRSSADALEGLGQLMVEVQLNKTMKSYTGSSVTFADGSAVASDTVIWTAGVTGVAITLGGTEVKPVHGGRYAVDEFNRVEGLDDVYAIGDIALMTTPDYPHGHPQVAQVAIQQGRNLAGNLSRADRPMRRFVYRDKGSMATIGRNRAVVDIGSMHLSGRIAWIAWLLVHLLSLVGMRNRTVTVINWTWSYFTFSAGLRLLLRPERYPVREYWEK